MIVYLISFVSLSLLSLYMATAILMNLVTYKLCTTFSLLSLFVLMVGIVSLLILHLLDISTLVGPVYILLPSSKTPTIVPNSGAGRVALNSLTSPVNGHSYWKSARFAAGATMTIS